MAACTAMSSGAASPPVIIVLMCLSVQLDDRVRHRDVVFDLKVWAHPGGVGDTVAECAYPPREVVADSMEVMDVNGLACCFA